MGTGDKIFLWVVLMIFFLLTWLKYIERHIPLYGLVPVGVVLAIILAKAFRPPRNLELSRQQDEGNPGTRSAK